MIQREKLKGLKTLYFQASTLILEPLKISSLTDPINRNELGEYLSDKNISYDDFKLHNYYDWQFTSEGDGNRLIPSCPRENPVKIDFPSGVILTMTKEQMEMPVVREGAFSSEEGDAPEKSSSDKLKRKLSNQLNLTPEQKPTQVVSTYSKWQSSGMNKRGVSKQIINNTFKGRVLKTRKIIEADEYKASNFPCNLELEPSFVKENIYRYIDAYYVGYLVEFDRKVTPMVANLISISDTMTWFHIAHLMMNKETKDTFSVFSYTTFQEYAVNMKNIPIYTDYTVNENSHASVDYYKRMYSIENQETVFKNFENYKKYFDPSKSLILVEQELMDQKSVPLMTHKRAALDYMNIAPMYKIIKDNTWSKMENVILKLPMTTTSSSFMFVTGTYGSLKINGSSETIYLDNKGEIGEIKRIKGPYAFYKVVHIEYHSPKLDKFIPDRMRFFFSIVIVTHNDPFETNPKKICDKPVVCSSVGWKKVEQKDPAFGFTYCCKFTEKFAEYLEIIPMYKCFMTRELLDLRLLWYVEANETIHPLGRDEFKLIKKKPPIYETVES